jgi:hypothetical protein
VGVLQPPGAGGVFFRMATRFVSIDRDTPLLLPPNLRDWVPADHLVHFILDAVDALDLRQVRVNTRGTGSEQYPPAMLLGLLLYSYATLEQNYYVGVVVSCEPIEARRGAGGLIAAELDQVGEAAKRFSDTPIRAVQK